MDRINRIFQDLQDGGQVGSFRSTCLAAAAAEPLEQTLIPFPSPFILLILKNPVNPVYSGVGPRTAITP
jgi:hypothetical protein